MLTKPGMIEASRMFLTSRMLVTAAAVAVTALLPAGNAAAETADMPIVVRGILPEALGPIGGSASTISADRLASSRPVTAKDALRGLPGVQVIDEDALGLKLNISVRGLNARRSGRTLLLEDGAPLQPAPYADPSAHHYTPLERTEQIELRKGSGQIMFGPQSIGGALNFATWPVPEAALAELSVAGGNRSFRNVHLALGHGSQSGGVRLDLLHKGSDGIRDLHASQVNEAALKVQLFPASAHRLTMKAAYYTERSRLSEAGLNQARFDISPYYNPFKHDRFRMERTALQLVHDWTLSGAANLSTLVYFADTFRASYRQTDTSVDAMVANPATGCTGSARFDYENFADACGNKMRPRHFMFWGIEPRLEVGHSLLGLDAETIMGARAHFERTNRKRLNGLRPDARETSPGTVLRDENDIDTDAYAAYVQTTFAAGALRLTPGVRAEWIETHNTSHVANFSAVEKSARTAHGIVLPGLGLTWSFSPAVVAFAGVHRGFAPPRPDRDIDPLAPFHEVRPERSTEFELGLRARPVPALQVNLTLFQMVLSDLIVEGQLVGGRSGTFVNAGRARHRGLELEGGWSRGPVRLGITYTWLEEASFLSDVGDGLGGIRGNRIPYSPEHMIDARIGLRVRKGMEVELGANHVSQQFANADNTVLASADGLKGTVPARTILRLAAKHDLRRKGWQIYLAAENILDTAYISSRIDGLFAGTRRQLVFGLKIQP